MASKKNLQGGMTLFFCITILVTLSLICTVIESARVYATMTCAKSVSYRALESEFARYSRQVFDDYGLLMKWEENDIGTSIYSASTIEQLKSVNATSDLLGYQIDKVKLKDKVYVTSNGGRDFVNQVIDYEKYAAAADGAEKLLEYCNILDSNDQEYDPQELIEEYEEAVESSDEEEEVYVIDEYNATVIMLQNWDYQSLVDDVCTLDSKYFDNNIPGEKELKKIRAELAKKEKIIILLNKKLSDIKKMQDDYETKKKKIERRYGELQDEDIVMDNAIYINDMLAATETILALDVGKMPVKEDSGAECRERYISPIIENSQKLMLQSDNLKKIEYSVDDEDNLEIFEEALDLLDSNILGIVKPDDMHISNYGIKTKGLPSKKSEADSKCPLNDLLNKGLFVYYINDNFGNALQCDSDNALQYGMEYVIAGKNSDKNNLETTVKEILGVRIVFNNLYIVQDAQKIAECSSIAASVSVAIGMPFLEPLIKLILMEAWVMMESISDVHALLDGGGVRFVKTAADWRTSLSGVGSTSDVNNKKKTEPGYEMYLMLLMMTKKNEVLIYRTLDLVQVNVQKKYNSKFKVNKCLTKASYEVQCSIKSILPGLGLFNGIGKTPNNYGNSISVQCGY